MVRDEEAEEVAEVAAECDVGEGKGEGRVWRGGCQCGSDGKEIGARTGGRRGGKGTNRDEEHRDALVVEKLQEFFRLGVFLPHSRWCLAIRAIDQLLLPKD